MTQQWGIPKFHEYLEVDEVLSIIDACKRERDRLVLRTMWESAGRVSEVLALVPEWIGERSIIIPNLKRRDKNETLERIVSKELCDALRLYVRKNEIKDSTPVFRANLNPEKALSSNYVWRLVTRITIEQGIVRKKKGKGITKGTGRDEFRPAWPHLFRHASGMNILRQTGSTEVTQEQLGHASIITTQGYAKIERVQARKKLEKVDWKGRKHEE